MTPPVWSRRPVVIAVLLMQPVPLLLFPPRSFSPHSQEWWLPVLLVAMAAVALLRILLRRTEELWPWNLMAFAQGFNIISRLMMLWPNATVVVGGATVFNAPYVALTLLAMALSACLLWYLELPEVRLAVLRD